MECLLPGKANDDTSGSFCDHCALAFDVGCDGQRRVRVGVWLQVLEKNRREPQYTNVTWTLVNSFASRESCDAVKADFPSDYKKTLERGDPVSIPVCLPDTVDPRGPKRSAR